MIDVTSRYAILAALCLSGIACNKADSGAATAQQEANVLTGDAAGSAATNPQCKAFTAGEVATYEGSAVNAGKNAAMGTGCQWTDVAGDDSAMVQIAPARYHEVSGGTGFKDLPDIGQKGFVVQQMGGWKAAAISGDKSINVLTGGKSDEARTIAFLKEAIKRSGG